MMVEPPPASCGPCQMVDLEAVPHAATNGQIVGRSTRRLDLSFSRFIGRPVEEIEAEIHFRQRAELAEARNADFRTGIGGLHIAASVAGSTWNRCCGRSTSGRRAATHALLFESSGNVHGASRQGRTQTYNEQKPLHDNPAWPVRGTLYG